MRLIEAKNKPEESQRGQPKSQMIKFLPRMTSEHGGLGTEPKYSVVHSITAYGQIIGPQIHIRL
jgi:hypothetical protein